MSWLYIPILVLLLDRLTIYPVRCELLVNVLTLDPVRWEVLINNLTTHFIRCKWLINNLASDTYYLYFVINPLSLLYMRDPNLAFGDFRLRCLARELSRGGCRFVCSFGIFHVETSLDNVSIGSVVWELSFGKISPGSFRVEAFAWETSNLSNWSPWGWGNQGTLRPVSFARSVR